MPIDYRHGLKNAKIGQTVRFTFHKSQHFIFGKALALSEPNDFPMVCNRLGWGYETAKINQELKMVYH